MNLTQSTALPKLKSTVHVIPGDDSDGNSWLIHEKINNQFFKIGLVEKNILSHWYLGDAELIIQALKTENGLSLDQEEIDNLLTLLKQHTLVELSGKDLNTIAKQHPEEQGWFGMFKQHLFIRLPLFKSDRFLTQTYPYMKWLFSNQMTWVTVIAGIICLGLLLQNMALISQNSHALFSWQGILLLLGLLTLNKCIHELGHAYMAKRYGLTVPNMGVVFMVFMPLMYTDTTSSWQLADAKARLNISLAGVRLELYVLIVLTLIFFCLPTDSLLADVIIFMLTVNWVLTLLINLNPLLRFDGYYALSDFLNVRGLQPRASLWSQYWLRKFFFSIETQKPEQLPSNQEKWMIVYGVAVVLYRLFIFLGIAVLIYHFVFKLLGIILVVIEIVYLIIRPIVTTCLWAYAQKHTRSMFVPPLIWVFAGIILLLCIPWPNYVSLPATYAQQRTQIYMPYPAEIKTSYVQSGAEVKQDELLFAVDSPELKTELHKTQAYIAQLEAELRQIHFNMDAKADIQTKQKDLARAKAKQAGIILLLKQGEIRSPRNGVVNAIATAVGPGVWVPENKRLATIIVPESATVTVYVPPKFKDRLSLNQKVTFVPRNLSLPTIQAKVENIGTHAIRKHHALKKGESARTLSYHMSQYQGQIATTPGIENSIMMQGAGQYEVRLTPESLLKADHVVLGTVRLQTSSQSLIYQAYQYFARFFHTVFNF